MSTAERLDATIERLAQNRYLDFLTSPGVGILWVLVFLFAPLSIIVLYSFWVAGPAGQTLQEFTLENYRRFFETPVYQRIVLNSFKYALLITAAVLPLGYTVGYFLGRSKSRWKPVLLALVVLQFWVPFIIRTYAWILMLSNQGFLNSVLMDLGVIAEPIRILYTTTSFVFGLGVSILPLMILPVYASVSQIDESQILAAKTLGASDSRAFREVTLPLSWPGVMSGILFVFIISAGSFLAPELLGSSSNRLIAPVIASVFVRDFNWPFAAALSVIYFLLIGVVLYLFTRKADLTESLERGAT